MQMHRLPQLWIELEVPEKLFGSIRKRLEGVNRSGTPQPLREQKAVIPDVSASIDDDLAWFHNSGKPERVSPFKNAVVNMSTNMVIQIALKTHSHPGAESQGTCVNRGQRKQPVHDSSLARMMR